MTAEEIHKLYADVIEQAHAQLDDYQATINLHLEMLTEGKISDWYFREIAAENASSIAEMVAGSLKLLGDGMQFRQHDAKAEAALVRMAVGDES